MPYSDPEKQRAAQRENMRRYVQTEHGRKNQRERSTRYAKTDAGREKARLRQAARRERLRREKESLQQPDSAADR